MEGIEGVSRDVGTNGDRPLLLVDIDGVISVFGFDPLCPPDGTWIAVEGIPHRLSAEVASRLQRLSSVYDPVWCSGWEEKANEHLPHLLGLGPWPHLVFDEKPGTASHWKLGAIDAFTGPGRAVAWVDDAHGEATHDWARRRRGPTLLVRTRPAVGLTEEDTEALLAWAAAPGTFWGQLA